MSVFGERIRAARTDAGLTQSKLAAACGVQVLSVSQWERRGTIPSAEHLARVAEVTGADPGWLLTGKAPSAECPAWVQDVKAWARATLDWAEQIENPGGADASNALEAGEPNGLAARLRAARRDACMSRRQLSIAAGKSPALVGQIERGEVKNPRADTVVSLAGALGVSLGWLVGNTDQTEAA